MANSNSGRAADTQLASAFKTSFCAVFCDRMRKQWRGTCRGCPAANITAQNYGNILIGDLLQVKRRRRKK